MVTCTHCQATHNKKRGFSSSGNQRYFCFNCGRSFTGNSSGRPSSKIKINLDSKEYLALVDSIKDAKNQPDQFISEILQLIFKPVLEEEPSLEDLSDRELAVIEQLINFGFEFNCGQIPSDIQNVRKCDRFKVYAELCFVTVTIGNYILSVAHRGNPYWRLHKDCFDLYSTCEKTKNIIEQNLHLPHEQLELIK